MDPNAETSCAPGAVIPGKASQNPNRKKLAQEWSKIPLEECQNRQSAGPSPNRHRTGVRGSTSPGQSGPRKAHPVHTVVRNGNGGRHVECHLSEPRPGREAP